MGHIHASPFYQTAAAPITSLYVLFCLLAIGLYRKRGLALACFAAAAHFYNLNHPFSLGLTEGIYFASSLAVWFFSYLSAEEAYAWGLISESKISDLQQNVKALDQQTSELAQQKDQLNQTLCLQIADLEKTLNLTQTTLAEKLDHLVWLQKEVDLLNSQKEEILLSVYQADETKLSELLEIDSKREEIKQFEEQKTLINEKLSYLSTLEEQLSKLQAEIEQKSHLEVTLMAVEEELGFLKEENRAIFSLKEQLTLALEQKIALEQELENRPQLGVQKQDLEAQQEELQALKQQIEEKNSLCDGLNAEIGQIKLAYHAKNLKVDELADSIRLKEAEYRALEQEMNMRIQTLESQLEPLQLSLGEYENSTATLKKKIDDLELEKESLNGQLASQTIEKQAQDEQLRSMEAVVFQLAEQRALYDMAALKNSELQIELQSLTQQKENFEKELQSLGSNKESLATLCLQLQDSVVDYKHAMCELESNIQQKDLLLSTQNHEIQDFREQIKQKDHAIESKKLQLEDAEQSLADFDKKILELEEQLTTYSAKLLAQQGIQEALFEKASVNEKEYNHLKLKFEEAISAIETKNGELSSQMVEADALRGALNLASEQKNKALERQCELQLDLSRLTENLNEQTLVFNQMSQQLQIQKAENQQLIERVEILTQQASMTQMLELDNQELVRVRGLYSQLRDQFKEKSQVLDIARQSLFKLEGELEALKIEAREKELYSSDFQIFENLVNRLACKQEEIEEQSAEIQQLQAFIDDLLQEV